MYYVYVGTAVGTVGGGRVDGLKRLYTIHFLLLLLQLQNVLLTAKTHLGKHLGDSLCYLIRLRTKDGRRKRFCQSFTENLLLLLLLLRARLCTGIDVSNICGKSLYLRSKVYIFCNRAYLSMTRFHNINLEFYNIIIIAQVKRYEILIPLVINCIEPWSPFGIVHRRRSSLPRRFSSFNSIILITLCSNHRRYISLNCLSIYKKICWW